MLRWGHAHLGSKWEFHIGSKTDPHSFASETGWLCASCCLFLGFAGEEELEEEEVKVRCIQTSRMK